MRTLLILYAFGDGKVGGRNTVLVDAITRRIPHVSDRPTIIFGADVTHPHPGEDSSPSIAAVSSLTVKDAFCVCFHGSIIVSENGKNGHLNSI